jgi:hypothetical protein
MANPSYGGHPIAMFYCGDDAEAKRTAAGLAREIGFDPVDAGPLSNARLLEPHATKGSGYYLPFAFGFGAAMVAGSQCSSALPSTNRHMSNHVV